MLLGLSVFQRSGLRVGTIRENAAVVVSHVSAAPTTRDTDEMFAWQTIMAHMKSRYTKGKLIALVAGCVLPVGCTAPKPLVISDLQTDKVVIRADKDEGTETVRAKAQEGCAIHNRKPLYLSTSQKCNGTICQTYANIGFTSCSPTDCVNEHLFACVQ
ncbi:hypothetical protein [Hoeflea sp.]|uniref:hypothetical protein n=1 Tax=Hoeflea sp. TaxID=1940281 RepID=UPI003B0284A2